MLFFSSQVFIEHQICPTSPLGSRSRGHGGHDGGDGQPPSGPGGGEGGHAAGGPVALRLRGARLLPSGLAQRLE